MQKQELIMRERDTGKEQYINIWNNREYPLNFKLDKDIKEPKQGQVVGYCDIGVGVHQEQMRYTLKWDQNGVISYKEK